MREGSRDVLAVASLCLSCGIASAQSADDPSTVSLSLWTSEAPIGSVLEQVVGTDVFEVRVGENVEGTVSGRIEGTVSEVLEPLLERYALTVHNDGSTVWFDPRDEEITERVVLDPEREPELDEWAGQEIYNDQPDAAGRAVRDGDSLVLSGSRAFVQTTLGRIEAARGALSEIAAESGDALVRDPSDVDAAPEIAAEAAAVDTRVVADSGTSLSDSPLGADEPTAAAAVMSPLVDAAEDEQCQKIYRSISDVPGFNTEYR